MEEIVGDSNENVDDDMNIQREDDNHADNYDTSTDIPGLCDDLPPLTSRQMRNVRKKLRKLKECPLFQTKRH